MQWKLEPGSQYLVFISMHGSAGYNTCVYRDRTSMQVRLTVSMSERAVASK